MFAASSEIFDSVVANLPIGLRKFLNDNALRLHKVEGEKKVQNRKILKVKRNPPQSK